MIVFQKDAVINQRKHMLVGYNGSILVRHNCCDGLRCDAGKSKADVIRAPTIQKGVKPMLK